VTSINRNPAEIAADALDQLDVCRETLSQLESLFWTLKASLGASHNSRIAALGAATALDLASLVATETNDWRAELETQEVPG
jgi:hypothetical protein